MDLRPVMGDSKERAERTKGMVAAGAATVLANAAKEAERPEATPTSIALAALFAAVGPTVAVLWQVSTGWHVRQTERWWKGVLHRVPEDLREQVEARVMGERAHGEQEPKTAKVIAACVRTILEGVDDALVPALSALAAEYLGGTKATDHFFRSMARTLGDLDAAGLDDLQRVVSLAKRFDAPGCDLEPVRGQSRLWILRQADEEFAQPAPEKAKETSAFPLHDGPALIGILKRHGLGWDTMTSLDRLNPFRCFLDVEYMKRTAVVVGE